MKLNKISFLVIFLILSFCVNLFLFTQLFIKKLQIGELQDTFNICKWAIADSKNGTQEEIADHMLYVKMYYPSGTKYVDRTGPLAEVIEENRRTTLFILKLFLEKRSGTSLDNDFDSIIEQFGSEETKERYKNSK